MLELNHTQLKHTFSTHSVPVGEMHGTKRFTSPPLIGDLALVEVVRVAQHTKIEDRNGAVLNLFPGDRFIGSFGNRYATDQFEGYVPKTVVNECDLLSIGGVLGDVASKHSDLNNPTRLKVLGSVCDENQRRISSISYGLRPTNGSFAGKTPEIVLVVGASMNSGKTTTCGIIARSMVQVGFDVAAAKITGTAASKDGRFFKSCGAQQVLDFTDAGYPATFLLGLGELMSIFNALVGKLKQANPDFIVIEIADGIFQRETRMLLECRDFTKHIDHVFFAANDSLSAECGARHLRSMGLPLRAVSGALTQGPLNIIEAEHAAAIACLSNEMILDGKALQLMPKKSPNLLDARRVRLAGLRLQTA